MHKLPVLLALLLTAGSLLVDSAESTQDSLQALRQLAEALRQQAALEQQWQAPAQRRHASEEAADDLAAKRTGLLESADEGPRWGGAAGGTSGGCPRSSTPDRQAR